MAKESAPVAFLDGLYNGRSRRAVRFRFALLALDVGVILFYFLTTIIGVQPWIIVVDTILGAVIVADLLARFAIAGNRRRFLLDPFTWADVIVAGSLLLPALLGNFAFLRVLRALRVLRSYQVLHELRRSHRLFRRHEEVIYRSLNLLVFVVIVSAFVHALQVGINPAITSYADALYFTVTALTTTGFGDVVLQGDVGRWLTIIIMVAGVGLFLRLAQSIFRPPKVRHKCPNCGLLLHDPDAIHCKHCGEELKIETEGA